MFNLYDAIKASTELNIKFNRFTSTDLLNGMNKELEHGLISSESNITDDNMILSAKLALAHLNKYPNYYNQEYGIERFEETLKNRK